MLTLFMSIAGGVSWEDAIAPLMAISTVPMLGMWRDVAVLGVRIPVPSRKHPKTTMTLEDPHFQ